MFIELTDHLRCPEDHEESFLVLLPGKMEGRLVSEGLIGCPVCHRETRIVAGVADFGGAPVPRSAPPLTAEAAHALLGLDGPGGYLALVGGIGAIATSLAALLPGISLVLVNPPADFPDSAVASVVRARRLPLKARSMRGIAVPAEFAGTPGWLEAAVDAVLPGLRVVAEGTAPTRNDLTVLAEAGGWWVGKKG
ncbi:MAG: hypothetical protein SGI84_06265 [Gemmatimonadota bacterium]|nr:hypothetical protein [Gemmatimonadota bacterium]